MTDQNTNAPASRGMFNRTGTGRLHPVDRIAVALGALWLLTVGAVFLLTQGGFYPGLDPVRVLMVAVVIGLPPGFLWLGALVARSIRVMRTESERVQAAISAMTEGQTTGAGVAPLPRRPSIAVTATARTDQAETDKSDSPAPMPRTDESQPAAKPNLPLPNADLIRALNFPDTENDTEGFTTLRRALRNRQAAKLLRASEDVLTLLSQEGIYTDDLRPDHARPDIWRRFAAGERGPGIAPLGGISDRASLALSAGRMQRDQIFRDAVHHFLREFDKMFTGFEPGADDGEITALADTRTARAFMLLGRVAGLFG